MGTASTEVSTGAETIPARSLRHHPIIGVLAATVINALLWAAGRAAGASFSVTLITGDTMEVGIVMVLLTTPIMLAAGLAFFTRVARRSDRRARAVLISGVIFTGASMAGPLTMAEEPTTALLLASMHLVTGTAFALTATTARL